MKHSISNLNWLRLPLIATLSLAALPVIPASLADTPTPDSAKKSITHLFGQISLFGSACVSSGIRPASTQLPTIIEQVKLGTPAYYAGIQQGDQILQARIDDNQLALTIKRNNQIFQTRLRAKTTDAPRPVSVELKSQQAKLAILKEYQIAFLLDRSGSMSHSLINNERSRWDWVKESVTKFCRKAYAQAGSDFDLCFFNFQHKYYKNQSAGAIEKALSDLATTGDTYLAPPLMELLAERTPKSNPKPLLLIVITDGHSILAKENADIILRAFTRPGVHKASKVVFLQVGFSEEGATFVTKLQHQLKLHGQNNLVHLVLFENTLEHGLEAGILPFLNN